VRVLILPVQVLTGTLPFGGLPGPEIVFKVLEGGKPLKPENASGLGLSEKVWKLLEDSWQSDRKLRPSVTDVSSRVKVAASVCGTLSSVGGVTQRQDDPDSDLFKFGRSLLHPPSDVEFMGLCRSIVPWNAFR